MRILYISNTSSISGAPAALVNIVKLLSGRHEIAVLLPDKDGPLYSTLTAMGVKCYSGPHYGLTIWPRVLNPVKFIKRIYGLTFGLSKVRNFVAEVIGEFRPDIVHTNAGPVDVALDVCVSSEIPHIWHLREFQSGMRFWPSPKTFRKKIMYPGNRNIAITSCVAEYWNLRDVDAVIYDGIVSESQLRSDADRDYLLSVGRVEKNKGTLELLRGYRLYRKKGGASILKIVGRMSLFYGILCRAFVRLSRLGSCVEFLGHRSDVPALMRGASALIVSSLTEGFGLVSVEAMLQDCVVIGNDTTGMKEQFDNGFEYTGKEIGLRYRGYQMLAEKMIEATSGHNDFDSMREGARQTVQAYYNLSDKVAELEKYYYSILETFR